MWQRLKLLKRFLGLFLRRQQAMALLERVQASSVSENDRALVTRIMRVMLKLPDNPGEERSTPAALSLLVPLHRDKRSVSAMQPPPHAAVSETRRDLVRLDKLPSNRYISPIDFAH